MKKTRNLSKIIAAGFLEASIMFYSFGNFSCATQKERTAITTINKNRSERAVIKSLSKQGISSLIDSGLTKKDQISFNQQYCRLMLMKNENFIRDEIDKFARYKFRNNPYKLYKTYESLFNVLKTVADFNNNRNGKAEKWEIDKYYEKFGDKPLVKILKEAAYFYNKNVEEY